MKNIITPIDEYICLEVTQKAALAAYDFVGKGREKDADAAAVKAMRHAFNDAPFKGVVVIGEGERDDAPMLYVGEEVGDVKAERAFDIAVDPLEGTTLTAKARDGALAVLALAPHGTLLNAPDVYMMKIAAGKGFEKSGLSLSKTPAENVQIVAKVKGKNPEDLTVCILDRERHQGLIDEVRGCGVRVHLIQDGDVWGAMATCMDDTGIDFYIGSGGAPEGVLAASALKCMDGFFEGQLMFRNDDEKKRAEKWGIQDLEKIYTRDDLVKNDVLFIATGVTPGGLVDGAYKDDMHTITHSVVLHAKTKTYKQIMQESQC